MTKKYLVIFCLFLLILPIVSSIPPVIQASEGDSYINIIYPKDEFYRLNSTFNMYFHATNLSEYLNNSQYSCIMHIYDTQNTPIYYIDSVKASDKWDVYFPINKSVTKNIGTVIYNVGCNTSRQIGFLSDNFKITVDSEEKSTASHVLLGVIILIPLIFGLLLLIGSMALGDDHTALKWFSYLMIPIFLVMSYNNAMIVINSYIGNNRLQELIATQNRWLMVLFGVLLTYVIIYFIFKMLEYAAKNKKERLEY